MQSSEEGGVTTAGDATADSDAMFSCRGGLVVCYSFVTPESVASIARYGLLAGEIVASSSLLLNLARPNAEERETWLRGFEEFRSDPEMGLIYRGPSVFFTMPDPAKLGPRHYISARGLLPIAVNLGAFMRDQPGTRIRGVELVPYRTGMSDAEFEKRERDLDLSEVLDYTRKSPEELWCHHDVGDDQHYASDVPHAIVVTPRIEPVYLRLP